MEREDSWELVKRTWKLDKKKSKFVSLPPGLNWRAPLPTKKEIQDEISSINRCQRSVFLQHHIDDEELMQDEEVLSIEKEIMSVSKDQAATISCTCSAAMV